MQVLMAFVSIGARADAEHGFVAVYTLDFLGLIISNLIV